MLNRNWQGDKQMAMPGSGAPVCFRHVQPFATVVGYGPAVAGGTASRLNGDAIGWPTGLAGDPAG